ncbi:MAG: hypothetical protein E7233_12315 [Lachnospiraceae bacterium]|nr:hypothetical protein [Lachnospiraceae bacterium]
MAGKEGVPFLRKRVFRVTASRVLFILPAFGVNINRTRFAGKPLTSFPLPAVHNTNYVTHTFCAMTVSRRSFAKIAV